MPPRKVKKMAGKASREYKVVHMVKDISQEGPWQCEEFEAKLNKYAKEGWLVNSSNANRFVFESHHILFLYALMEK